MITGFYEVRKSLELIFLQAEAGTPIVEVHPLEAYIVQREQALLYELRLVVCIEGVERLESSVTRRRNNAEKPPLEQ